MNDFFSTQSSSIENLLKEARKEITPLDARRLAEFCFALSPLQIITQKHTIPSHEKIMFFKECVALRKKGHAVSEITQQRDFYGMSFFVNNDVLTPRPETEWLVEYALKKNHFCDRIIDIGTGSGCIAIAFSRQSKKEILAIDISSKALLVAKKNAMKLLSFHHQIIFRQSDLLEHILPKEIENAGIITNLPYIPSEDILEQEVLLGDPLLALFSGKDGLDLYRRFFLQLQNTFAFCAFEFHPPQKEELEKIITQQFPNRTIEWGKDYHNDIRFGVIC